MTLVASILTNQAVIVAAIAAVPSAALGWFGYQRSKKVDAITQQSQVAEFQTKGVDQVIEGLNKLVANLQSDNAILRDNVRALDEKLSRVIEQCDELRVEIRDLRRQLS